MSLLRVYFDESGYTRGNFLDSKQPFFVQASHNLSDDEINMFVERYFDFSRDNEIKYSQIKKRHLARVTSFIGELSSSYLDRFFVWVVHKEYCLVCKLVDLVCEPIWREEGLDPYKNGIAPDYANMLYMVFRTHLTKPHFRIFLNEILDFFKQPSREYGLSIIEKIKDISKAREYKKLRETILKAIYPLSDCITRIDPATIDKKDLDIAGTGVFNSCCIWKRRLNKEFLVIHDNSSELTSENEWIGCSYQDALNDIMSGSVSEERITRGGDVLVEFPIKCQIQFSDSKLSPGIQIADIISGVFADGFGLLDSDAKGSTRKGVSKFQIDMKNMIHGVLLKKDSQQKGIIGGLFPGFVEEDLTMSGDSQDAIINALREGREKK